MMAEVSQQKRMDNMLITIDTGSRYNIVDQEEANLRGWKVDKITDCEKPSLKCPDERKLKIIGKTTLWLCLAKEEHNRKVDLYMTPHLQSKILIGLIDLKRLHWVSPQWPLNIEKWAKVFTNASKEDVVNEINDSNSSKEEEVTVENKIDAEEEADNQEEDGGTFDITDFTDLKTYKDIPNFSNLPTWLQDLIKEFKIVSTNQLLSQSIMKVEPVTFFLRDIKIPNNNLTAHLPQASLKESADKLLDKLESGGLIKKAPRLCRCKSKASSS